MKLKDLPTDKVSAVVTAPLSVDQPADRWKSARDAGVIPGSLYDLYRLAGCLDATTPPKYLSEFQSIALFSFFKGVMESLRDSFEEAEDQVRELKRLRELEWAEVGARMKERDQHPVIEQISGFPKLQSDEAGKYEPRVFRSLLIVLSGALDQAAELIAIFMFGGVKRLNVGKADFDRVFDFLSGTRPVLKGIVAAPHEVCAQSLYDVLRRQVVVPAGPESEWYQLFRLYRNKTAHLGRHTHFTFGVADDSRRMYLFLRRDWPFSLEAVALYPTAGKSVFDGLIQQDMLEFSAGLLAKVRLLVEIVGVNVIEAFKLVRDSSPPTGLLQAFVGSHQRTAFEYFEGL